MINWTTNETELDLIDKIVTRAFALYRKHNLITPVRRILSMDLMACNKSCPLDLLAMLNGSNGDFSHDIGGIQRYIDRETGVLGDCFVPRFARREEPMKRSDGPPFDAATATGMYDLY